MRQRIAPALSVGDFHSESQGVSDRVLERAEVLRLQGLKAGQVVLCPTRPLLDFVLMQFALPLLDAALLPVVEPLSEKDQEALVALTGAEWRWQPAGPDVGAVGALEATMTPTDAGIGRKGDDGDNGDAAAMLTATSLATTAFTGASLNTTTFPAPAEIEFLDQTGRLCPLSSGAVSSWQTSDPLALIIRTSGSSGEPKAVMLSRNALQAACERSNAMLGLGAEDCWLGCLPLQHIGGLAIGYRCRMAGARLRLHAGFDPDAIARDFHKDRITHLSLVPPMLARLLDAGIQPPRSLRVALIGGQSLHPTLAQRALAAGWPLWVSYGMSETCSQVALRQLGPDASSGFDLLPDVAIDAPDCAVCSVEQASSLRLRGPMLMAGYANPQRRPGQGLDDGWLTTGDLGCLDEQRRLQILGRADDRVVIAGVQVLPAQVERALLQVPGVSEVAVLAQSDPIWGQTLIACFRGSASTEALDAWCRQHLSSAERPRRFIPMDAFPRLASGKLDRAALKSLLS